MFDLLVLYENVFNGYKEVFLDITSLASILSGIMVITSKNPVVSILFLIGLFLSISFYLILLGLNFIGLSYLLVYIGAVSILFLFILMLINVRISELLTDSYNSLPLLIMINVSLYVFISNITPLMSNTVEDKNNLFAHSLTTENSLISSENIEAAAETIEKFKPVNGFEMWNYVYETYNYNPNYVTSLMWDGNLAEHSHIASIGNIMYTSYSIWLLLTSIILLLAMVGCIVITIKRKTDI